MAGTYDAVIIGAGVFGAGIAFELSKRGLRTCNVDMFGAAGHGSTSSSGAIIRFNTTVTEILTTDDASAVRGVALANGSEIHAPIVVNVGVPFRTD